MILSATTGISEDSERIILRETSLCKSSQTNLSLITVELKPEVSFNFSLFSISVIEVLSISFGISISLIIQYFKAKINRKSRK